MTGWRVGYVHGPRDISVMLKLQQYSFVCAPQPAQWGHWRPVDLSSHVNDYRQKRDFICAALSDHYEISKPNGAFYVYPKAPGDSGEKFVERAIAENLLIVPEIYLAIETLIFE